MAIKAQLAPRKKLTARFKGITTYDDGNTFILLTEDGQAIPAVVVEEETIFTATEDDIRVGTVAATAAGVTPGAKEIPAYHTTEGVAFISAGSEFIISIPESDRYDFTKLQAILCPYNKTIVGSVAADKVAIENNVYAAGSTDALATITVDHDSKSIRFGITNNGDTPYIIRYFTYKEEI